MATAVEWRNEAEAAYRSGNFAQSADAYAAAIEAHAKLPRTFYNAACSAALAGRTQRAFTWLDTAITKGWRDVDHLKQDRDFASLRADPRWAGVERRVERAEVDFLTTLTHAPLRKELLHMLKVDQDVRTRAHNALLAGGPHQAAHDNGSEGKPRAPTDTDRNPAHAHNGPLPAHGVGQLDIDIKHTARLKQIIDEYGWPMDSMVGREGGLAAFLLAQHADADPVFQRRCLELMRSAPEGEVSKNDLAYLTDRVLVNSGKKQQFGTQFWMVKGKLVPRPIADEANLEKRRAHAGMISMEVYRRHMEGHSEGGSHDH